LTINYKDGLDFNVVAGSKGKARIEQKDTRYVLYLDELKWMVFDSKDNLAVKEFYSSYDLAYGNVLVSGLGFGILTKWLAKKSEVKSITVIEQSQDIVDMFLENNNIDPKIKIYVSDIRQYKDNKSYDWILLDHYEEERKPIKEDLEIICSNIKTENLWFWSLEFILLNHNSWSSFRENYSKKIPNIALSKVIEYVIYITGHKHFTILK
jgi:hypothetical protein